MPNRKTIEQNLRLALLDLAVGETRQITCPFCGAQHERSLGVTRAPEGIVYRCWRAKCRAKGFIGSSSTDYLPDWENRKTKAKKPKIFDEETTALPDEYIDMLYDKYTLTEKELIRNGFLYAPNIDRVIMPIYNAMGYKVGVVARTYDKNPFGPKTINYLEDGRAHLHYARTAHVQSNTAVLVEDIPSAIRVSRYAKGVALLGHALCDATAEEVEETSTDLIVALDPDAVDKAIKLKKKYQLYFNSIRVRVLSSDPKDYESDEQLIEEILT